MIISLMLILAIAWWGVPYQALLALLITWLPDLFFLGFLEDLIERRKK